MDYSRDLDLVNDLILCSRCMKREGIKAREGECYICNGLMDKLDEIFELIKHAIKDYEFNTFLIGATVHPSILEREDELRSRLKIKGRRSIKNEITSTLGKMLSSSINAKVSFTDPDLIIHIDLMGRFVTINSKAIYLFGKYKKEKRGIEQRATKCINCNGIGCHQCNFKGVTDISIESILADHLIQLYNADQVKFSWVGGEDEDSLVLNKGRPFFVKIINPRKRSIDYSSIIIKRDGVTAWFIKEASKFPDKSIRFRSKFRILADAKLDTIPDIKLDSVNVTNKHKSIKKKIYQMKITPINDGLEIILEAESGLPIKRFVEGNGIEPSLSELLNTNLKCKCFDVLDVKIEEG
ncbi:MAG: tRNA pseudouridine(54/55) synthase Pus10 [Candidatus Nitrosocaldaceae archaeon]|nr:MAG: tRNA pseudouridine(54/55) synthase Pus10 [Candidatus Nitrosocaldaceae archaeon]